MKHEGLFWLRILALLTALAAAVTGRFIVVDWPHWDVVVIAALFVAVITSIAVRVPNQRDESWLPALVVGAFFVKLLGSGARWWVLVDTYDGVGDSFAYHNRALTIADTWRRLEVPQIQVGSTGTTFATKTTGLLYAPHEPSSILGGFFIFATLAFLGQLLLYLAFRRAQPDGRLKLYAVVVLTLPSLVFWPSSVGKESLMLFFIGVAAYGLAGLFADYHIMWVPVVVLGTAAMAGIRLHVAALFATAAAAAVFLARRPARPAARVRRMVMLGLAATAVVLLLTLTSETFGIDPDGDDLDPFLDEIQRRTQQGGSAVEGQAVRDIFAVPDATMRVLFRPLPTEATSVQAFLSAFESLFIILIIVWRSPTMLRSLRHIRRNPYLLFSLGYVVGFVIAFSAIFNLGILARQRTQAMPFLLALIVGLGWREELGTDETPAPDLARTQ